MSGKQHHQQRTLIIEEGALVCELADIRGHVTIGAGSVVHPCACIYADAGPIVIGKGNIIEELAVIRNAIDDGDNNTDDVNQTLFIGDNNLFEVRCAVSSLRIGNGNIVGIRSSIDRTSSLGNNCIVGAGCSIERNDVISDNTVIHSKENLRNMKDDDCSSIHQSTHKQHLNILRTTLPKYHHIVELSTVGSLS